MEMQFDWPKIHESVLFEQKTGEKSAQVAARRIEQAIRDEGLPVGSNLGTSPSLCDRFQVGRETLLEAIRLLEARGVARMRRGRCGGLVVAALPAGNAAQAITRYLAGLCLSGDQMREARQAFAILAAEEFLTEQGRGDTFEVLFAQLITDGRSPLSKPLPAAYADLAIRNRALRPFVDAVDALGAGMEDDHHNAAGKGLVKLTHDYLIGELQRLQGHGVERLGSEAQLAERIGVSRQVLRQAMRLLEEQGLLACRRGRSNGIATPSNHPAWLVGAIGEDFARLGLRYEDFRSLQWLVDRINRSLFACKADSGRFDALEQATNRKDWGNSATHIRRFYIEWPVIDNPVLSLIEQTLAAYRARSAGAGVIVVNGDLGKLQRNALRQVAMMRAGNLAGADRLSVAMQAQIAEMLGEY